VADDAERLEDEVTARGIEWWLDKRSDPNALAGDEFISLVGARRAIEAMKSRHTWLDAYIQEVKEAAEAEAAVEGARKAGADTRMAETLEGKAKRARMGELAKPLPKDSADVIRAHGKLHHMAASQPPDVEL